MRVIHIDLPYELKKLEIVGFGDAHLGEEFSDIDSIKNTVEYILAEPNRYAIINGDWQNMGLKMSKSDVYSEQMSPMMQVHESAKILKPIKHRILLIEPGNHEERVYKETGIDVGELLAMELGLLDRYARTSAVLFVSFGESSSTMGKKRKKNVYSIYCNHGFGGGSNNGGKLNKVMRLDNIVDADLYVMGHHHTPAATKSDYFRLDYQNKKVTQVTRSYLLHNAWLKYGGYGERFGYAPGSITISRAILNGHGKKAIELII